ncbi:MAG TPA: hypothetical protein VMU67_03240 [Steroidobacteraceae bacterium]|nr:hypothetical protein [Steroidobacteraceae bacterium]
MTIERRRLGLNLFGSATAYLLPRQSEDPEPPPPDSRRAALVGLVFTLLLILGSVLLVHVLGRAAKLQDCVMSGRTNCAPVDTTSATGG